MRLDIWAFAFTMFIFSIRLIWMLWSITYMADRYEYCKANTETQSWYEECYESVSFTEVYNFK